MQVQVRTTQNVFIHYPVASLGDRILAYLVDGVIKIVYIIALIALLLNVKVNVVWIWIVTIVIPIALYHLLFEIFMDGQGPGKRAMNIKVVRLDGTPATVGDYILRWLFAIVDVQLFSGLIAVLCIAVGGQGQRLGDMVAGTTVVKIVEDPASSASEVFVPQDATYTTVFPQVTQLTEHDIELVQRALEVSRDTGNSQPVLAATEKIKALIGVQTDLPPVKFLYTVIKDFQHLTSR
jgi:uncharacterized RDD family membrane protein YckC